MPRSRSRQALIEVDPNAVVPAQTDRKVAFQEPVETGPTRKTSTVAKRKNDKLIAENEKQKAELQKKEQENEALKDQIAALTEKLAKSTIAPKSKSLPAAGFPDPFGASFPAPPTQTILPPKRPISAFQRFCADRRDQVKKENPEFTGLEVTDVLRRLWGARTEEENAPYHEMEAQDKNNYENEKAEYEKKRSEMERARRAMDLMKEEKVKSAVLKFYEEQMAETALKALPATAHRTEIPRPKNARSAWNFFQKHFHEEVKNKPGNDLFSFAEISNQVGAEWKRLQTSKKKKDQKMYQSFEKQAKADRERYDEEKAAYNARVVEKRRKEEQEAKEMEKEALEWYAEKERETELLKEGKKAQAEKEKAVKQEKKQAREQKKAAREAKAALPKGARSAYNFYMREQLPKMKEAGLEAKDAMSAVASQWKALDDESKKNYNAMAAEDKTRFENEMNAASAPKEE